MSSPAYNPYAICNEAAKFLEALDPDARAWTFQTFDDTQQKRSELVSTRNGTFAELTNWLYSMNGKGAGVFVTVNETDARGRKKENILRVRALFADFDISAPDTAERLRADPMPPSIIVESSRGKLHAYWLVDGVELDEFKSLQQAIARHWGSDLSVCDLPRVMRLPGFHHCKGEPQPVQLIEANRKLYGRELVCRYLPTPSKVPPVGPLFAQHCEQRDIGKSIVSVYGEAALQNACKKVSTAPEGTRNPTLNSEAFNIAQLVAGGELASSMAWEALANAAIAVGLGQQEINFTLNSAFQAGQAKPRTAPAGSHELPEGSKRAAAALNSQQTAPPEPLLPELAKATGYPIEALPTLMREAAEAIAEHVQASLAMAGQCVIGTGAHLAQTRVNAPHIHSPDGMPCSLFLLTLADSGDRKSGCRDLAFKTLDEAEAKARTEHQKCRIEKDRMADSLKKGEREQFLGENPLPLDPRTQYSDATFERIAGDMIRGTPAASWDTDEGGQMLGGASLKADTRAATLGGLVKAFDSGAFERTRSHGNLEGSGFAYHRRLSIHLLAQAVTVADALDDPLLRGQGFLPRFLFASPASIAGTRLLSPERLERKAYTDPRLQRYWARCAELMVSPGYVDPETSEVRPPVLPLTGEGDFAWLNFYNEVEHKQAPLEEFAGLRPFAGRAGELARRVAAVFACFERRAEIDADCMSRAAAIVRYSLSEWARYTEGERVSPQLKQAIALMDWLRDPRRIDQWREFHVNILGKSGPPFARKAKQRDAILLILVERRHLLTDDGKQFRINPLAEIAVTAESQQIQDSIFAENLRKFAETARPSMASAPYPQPSANPPQPVTPIDSGLPQNPQFPYPATTTPQGFGFNVNDYRPL